MHPHPDETTRPRRRARAPPACALGGQTEDEHIERHARLLSEALGRLSLIAVTVRAVTGIRNDEAILLTARHAIAATLRLTHTALDHARDVGYQTRHCLRGTAMIAQAIADDLPAPSDLALLRDVDEIAQELVYAPAALQADRMAVPERLSPAFGALLALYARVDIQSGSTRPRATCRTSPSYRRIGGLPPAFEVVITTRRTQPGLTIGPVARNGRGPRGARLTAPRQDRAANVCEARSGYRARLRGNRSIGGPR